MGVEEWSASRWLSLLALTFLLGAFLAIGILFRLGGDTYAVSESTRGSLAILLSLGVSLSWLFLAVSSFVPRLRAGALLLLIAAYLANMAVPTFLPESPPPPSGAA